MFIHEQAYRGEDLLEKLNAKKIVVCGAGALGSNLVDTLCRQGFTNLAVIDMDRVEEHNINTQTFTLDDVGRLKADALKNKVFRTTKAKIESISKELTDKTIHRFFTGAGLVVDVFDNHMSRALVYEFCGSPNHIPCLHSGMIESFSSVVWNEEYVVPKDQVAGDVCDYPLARNLAVLTASLTAEIIINYLLEGQMRSVCFTLKDLKISNY